MAPSWRSGEQIPGAYSASSTWARTPTRDGSHVPALLDQIQRPIPSFTADGAYDQGRVYEEVAARYPNAAVIVPPRSTAVPSTAAATTPAQRDRHLRLISEHVRIGWQKISSYQALALVEADIHDRLTLFQRAGR